MSHQDKMIVEARKQEEEDSKFLLLEIEERKKNIALVNQLESIEQVFSNV